MNYIEDLKHKTNILQVANKLGFYGTKSGRCWQGDCPMHSSAGRKCMVIWSGINAWKCYHCHKSGDVIGLVMLYKKCNFMTAVNYLADIVGMPHLGISSKSPDEVAKILADEEHKTLVFDMLTTAADWYHVRLKDYPSIKDHLLTHYKFSETIIEELQIGFAPPTPSQLSGFSDLADHLSENPRFKGNLAMTSLFSFKNPQGPYYDYFKGRITVPYWKNGRVVDLIARATDLTPVDEYECYK